MNGIIKKKQKKGLDSSRVKARKKTCSFTATHWWESPSMSSEKATT